MNDPVSREKVLECPECSGSREHPEVVPFHGAGYAGAPATAKRCEHAFHSPAQPWTRDELALAMLRACEAEKTSWHHWAYVAADIALSRPLGAAWGSEESCKK